MNILPFYVILGLLFIITVTYSQSLTVEVEYEFCGSLYPAENVSVSFCPTQIRPGEGCAVYETDENGIVGPVSVGGIPNKGSNLVWIRVQGFNSSPSYYAHNIWTQPPSSYHFTIPADAYFNSVSHAPLMIGTCTDFSGPISTPEALSEYGEPTVFGNCDTSTLAPSTAISWDPSSLFNIGDQCMGDFPGCVRMSIINRVDSTVEQSSTIDEIECRHGDVCSRGPDLFLSELSGGEYTAMVEIGCCEGDGGFTPYDTILGNFNYATQPAEVDVDFDFGVSNQIEIILGDTPLDGQIPRATSRPGPEIGPLLSRFTNANSTGETNYIQSYTYALWEVNCSGPETPVLIASYTAAPVNGGQPENIDFASILELDSVGGDYFINNREGCYKATLTANNICDTITASGYFQITDQCTFCRRASDEREEVHVLVYPTLVNDNINVLFDNVEGVNVQLQVFNSIGQLVKQFDVEHVETGQSNRITLSELSSGVYLYRALIDEKLVGHGKLIKQ